MCLGSVWLFNPRFKETPEIETIDELDNTIKIHVNTLKPYTGYGPGRYIISSVKQMSTTDDFNSFPEDVKHCQNKETIEECSQRKIMEGAVKHCGCLPGFVNILQNALKVNKSYRQG